MSTLETVSAAKMNGVRARELALNRINEAKDKLDQVYDLEKNGVNGANKLRKRIQAEINFLNRGLRKGSELKEQHVQCSNLGQLGALASVAVATPNTTGLLQTFCIKGMEKIVVDVVGEGGKQWIKVILRNPKALHMLFISGGRNGVKPLDEVADGFLICAQHHPVFYSVPKIVFWFCSGVSEGLAKSLQEKSVEIKGKIIPDHEFELPDYLGKDSETESEDSETESDDSETESEDFETDSEDSDSESEYLCDKKHFVNESISCTDGSAAVEVKFASVDTICDHKLIQQSDSESDDSPEIINVIAALGNTSDKGPSKSKSGIHYQVDKADVQSSASITDFQGSYVTEEEEAPINKANLDVTAMIAYVTATTNGSAGFIFKDKYLTEQAMCERKDPVKKTLDGYFKGLELIACQEAVNHFLEIVDTIGGKSEKARAKELVSRLNVVPGEDCFKDKVRLGGRVRELSRIIFGTGHYHRALTITSNGGFVRSAEHQGVKVAVLYHKPRALTEAKEPTATPL